MYNFIYNQWVLGKYSESQVQTAVTKGYINQEQADTILESPKVV